MSSFAFQIYISYNLSENAFLLLEHSQKNTDDIAKEVTGTPCIHFSDAACSEATVQCVYLLSKSTTKTNG